MSKDKDKDQGTKSTKGHKDKKAPRRAWMRVHVLRMGAGEMRRGTGRVER